MEENNIKAIPEITEITEITDMTVSTPEIAVRTPGMIAGEIIAIKEHTRKILLVSAVEIGRRLAEAREIIPYGEFGKWLEETVDYSESTAYNLMRLAEEYGHWLSAAGGRAVAFAKLGYTQALTLLGLPKEERAEFIVEFDIENMAVSELKQAINDKQQALAQVEGLQEKLEAKDNTIAKLTEERNQALSNADNRKQALWDEKGKNTVLKREIEVISDGNATARCIEDMKWENRVTKIKLAIARADARYDLIGKGFDDLLIAIRELAASDPEAFRLYRKKVNEYIMKLSKRLNRIKVEPQADPTEAEAPETQEAPAVLDAPSP